MEHETDAPADTPLLWVLRDHLGLTGTKFGCGAMACGACTVILDGSAERICQKPLSDLNDNTEIVTIEGLAALPVGKELQRAWVEKQAPQCGYCQSGMIMKAYALLKKNPNPTDDDITDEMDNICRCGTYTRVREAIKLAAELLSGKTP